MIKGSIQQKDIILVNTYAQKVANTDDIKEGTENKTIIVGL